MAYSIKANMNLNGNEIQNVVVDKQTAAPGTGVAGRIIYVTDTNKLMYYNGTAWVAVTTSESGEYQLLSEKNEPEGYAGLDASGKLAIGQIPTGVAADLVPLLKGAIANGQSLKYDSTAGGFVAYDISAVYSFKGTCTSEELNEVQSPQAGDVYNVTDQRSFNGQTYQAGTNWVWDATAPGQWEPLTGIIDLSGYQTVNNIVDDVGASASTGIDNTHYPSALATKTAIDAVRTIASAAVVANSAITGGTFTKVTVDAKGLVTAGAQIQAADIPDISATYVKTDRLGTDVATLVSGTVPISQLPTGNADGKIPVLDGAGTAGQAVVVNADGDGFTFRTVPDHSMSRVSFQITGNGTTQTFNQAINFDGELPSAVTIIDGSGNICMADVNCTTSQVTVTMTPAPAVGENYTVRIIG